MPSVPNVPKITIPLQSEPSPVRAQSGFVHMRSLLRSLPRNVYILYLFTLGKGFQLTIALLNINYYAHSLGYRPDFIGVLNAASAIGALVGAVPTGPLADRIGRKPVLLVSAVLTPLFLACIGLVTTAPLKQEREQSNKTKNRYQVALFDHGNFRHRQTGPKKKRGEPSSVYA